MTRGPHETFWTFKTPDYRLSALAAAVLILVATASGSARGGTPLEPPARYDHPFAGSLTIVKFDKRSVSRECSKAFDGRKVRPDAAGCAILISDTECVIYLATRTKRAPLADILRHEIAHCNGWPGDHPH
jgi:hypothetical protein